jgi:hypothetical protein
MSDLLAIIDPLGADDALVEEIIRRSPDRVTLLIESAGADWDSDDSPRGLALRERLNQLLSAIEAGTTAVVVGLVSSRDQLLGWRFDRIVGGRQPQPA